MRETRVPTTRVECLLEEGLGSPFRWGSAVDDLETLADEWDKGSQGEIRNPSKGRNA